LQFSKFSSAGPADEFGKLQGLIPLPHDQETNCTRNLYESTCATNLHVSHAFLRASS